LTTIAVAPAEPSCKALVCNILQALGDVQSAIEVELQGVIALEKACVVASHPVAARAIRRGLRGLGGREVETCEEAAFLGVGITAGRPYRRGHSTVQRKRISALKGRVSRLSRLAQVARAGKARPIYKTGLVPAAGFGAEVTGLRPKDLRLLRQWAGSSLRRGCAGKSLRASLLANEDPSASYAVAATVRWAREV